MSNKKLLIAFLLFFFFKTDVVSAQPVGGFGQAIQIRTRLHSFIGKPSWLIIIRDLDNNQTLPFLYDFSQGNNFWLAFTYGRNYLITVSTLQFATYRSCNNKYRQYKISNFCNLESNGHIMHGESLRINLEGDLSPYSDTYYCDVTSYSEDIFTIAPSATLD